MSFPKISYFSTANSKISLRIDGRVLSLVLASWVLLAALIVFATTLGTSALNVNQVFEGLLGTAERSVLFIVRTVRLPRIIAAVLVGMALAVSGNIFQNVLGNPLASPDIVGINSGASAAVVFIITSGLPTALIPVSAIAASLSTAALLYILAFKNGMSPLRIILVGIGINSLLTAAVQFMLVRGEIHAVSQAYRWLVGSLYTANWKDVRILLLLPCVLFLMATIQRGLRTLQLGDVAAGSVGLNVNRIQFSAMALACVASSLAVSVAGPLGFVALIVPHISRTLSRRRSFGDLLFAANLGGILVLASDLTVQHVLPEGLPVGIVVSILGAPYFLYLLARMRGGA